MKFSGLPTKSKITTQTQAATPPPPITKKSSSSFLILGSWLATTIVTFCASVYTLNVLNHTNTLNASLIRQSQRGAKFENAITAYAALPASVSEIQANVLSADARPATIEAYLSAYNSPMVGLGEFIVKTADKHEIDPYLIVAIAQQESNLCKIIPDDSHNCWGWGIHSEGTLKFESYEQAAQAVIRGLKENYLDKGYNSPQEIMGKYTPQSNGSWANGVTQFMAELTSGNF